MMLAWGRRTTMSFMIVIIAFAVLAGVSRQNQLLAMSEAERKELIAKEKAQQAKTLKILAVIGYYLLIAVAIPLVIAMFQ
jgi:ABC-type antimicrobial peptide transport system permease subunit